MPDSTDEKVFYLPLVDKDGVPLPLHFLTQSQVGAVNGLICKAKIFRQDRKTACNFVLLLLLYSLA